MRDRIIADDIMRQNKRKTFENGLWQRIIALRANRPDVVLFVL
jgi:hypothetical protein